MSRPISDIAQRSVDDAVAIYDAVSNKLKANAGQKDVAAATIAAAVFTHVNRHRT
jgi:hypothetical protein